MLMKKPWQEHLFFIKGYRKHHTGGLQRATSIPLIAQGGQQEPPFVNHQNTLWAAMNGNDEKKKRKMPIFPTRWQQKQVEWCGTDCLLRAARCTGSQMIWPKIISVLNDFKKRWTAQSTRQWTNAPSDFKTQGLKTSSATMVIPRTGLITWACSKLSCIITIDQYFPSFWNRSC